MDPTTIIVAACVAAGPTIGIMATSRAARMRQLADWKRQDEVMRRAETEARAQRASQERIGSRTEEAVRTAMRTEEKVDEIHKLVNSNLTTSFKAQESLLVELIKRMDADLDRLGKDSDASAIGRRDAAVDQLDDVRTILGNRDS